ncbi:hypothetical protein B0H16DRAFT_1885408 [Mycena metata]|uniref:Uncharacterized protein n=1 Tax=Mycena metata TaxID=1033252 RepID=A0AAD7J7K5_9AGAR|nr:hypothetical protein B0H16DRAFT_1885408 [Mycena metata]
MKTVRPGFRGLAASTTRRPRRLRNMHIPQTVSNLPRLIARANLPLTTWDYWPRKTEQPHSFGPTLERGRNWVSIPDANLPEPWTCNWTTARWTAEVQPLEATLASQYALNNVPLTPVMFNAGDGATVFGCSSTAFIEQADWNRMERMDPVGSTQQAHEAVPSSISSPALALIGEKGFRVAAQQPYQKRTLWEMCPPPGTLGYIPRQLPKGFDWSKYPGVSEWPRTPDTMLPEPWSANWDAFVRAHYWYDEVQAELEDLGAS